MTAANVLQMHPARDRRGDVAFAYQVATRRRTRQLRDLLETEMQLARLAIEAMRLVPVDSFAESLDLALIARHHHETARELRKRIQGRIEL